MAKQLWIATFLALGMGCSSEPDPPADGDVDTGTDADVVTDDADVIVDGDIDAAADVDIDGDGDETDADPEVAPYVEPEPLLPEHWLVGLLPRPDDDPIRPAIEDGTFEVPEEGADDHGIVWRVVEPSDDGSLGYVGQTVGYAIALFDVDEATRVVARTDFTLGVYTNGALQPGDVYGSRHSRVPLLLHSGENTVIVRTYGVRGSSQAQLWTTPDELFYNLDDLTFPELVVGRDQEQWVGVPVLNLIDREIVDLTARVVESEWFEASESVHTAIGPRAVTQLAFELVPKQPFITAEETIPVTLQLEAPGLEYIYEREIELTTVEEGVAFRQTFLSPVDGSVQYYGVLPPTTVVPGERYGLVVSLHGAGVEAINQARSYSQRDWTYLIAPTNRRPFGFDWEEWGRLNGLAAMDDAMRVFAVDPLRTYLTGHSMGGHGTWHVGVTTPTRFATIGPSAGWSSFYSYTGDARPTGAFGRARAHSDTMSYITNLAQRGVYILHGSADDNVPVREGRDMFAAVSEVTDDILYHEEPDVGHWWDGEAAPGVDCVDWLPLFEFMHDHTFDPYELDFEFTSPAPWYSATHSFVTLWSAEDPYLDCVVGSEQVDEDTVSIITENVRTLAIDADVLGGLGIVSVEVDGETHALPDAGELIVGPTSGKRPNVSGPYLQVFHRPFCFVYPDGEEGAPFSDYVAYLTSYWAVFGNGHACALPLSEVDDEVRTARNLIYVGVSADALPDHGLPISWNDEGVDIDGDVYRDSAMMFVFPDDDHERLNAVLVTSEGEERLLYMLVPFSSRAGMPDYLVWSSSGAEASGFFSPEWTFDPTL